MKTKTSLSLSLSLIVVVLLSIVTIKACNLVVHEVDSPDDETLISFNDYLIYGKIHNHFLTNLTENFNPDWSIYSRSSKIDFVNAFNLDFLEQVDFGRKITEKEIELFSGFSYLTDYRYAMFAFYPDEYRSKLGYHENADDMIEFVSLHHAIEEMYLKGLIDYFEYSSLSELSNKISLSLAGMISIYDFELQVNQLIDSWNNMGYLSSSSTGHVLASVLSVGHSSIEWWIQNPDAGYQESEFSYNVNLLLKTPSLETAALPAWAALDIAGAIVGAAGGAIASYAGTGSVNGTSVAVASCFGAVVASTGAVGRVASWLR